ncbi:hypothetical protein NDU88_003379 [Pleurodeles waltl]|uniref:Uncharacterized protein n=1 Tax=Pleurodeles waltl TaxID=8319 RepID=A0AAV7RH78_PLEWA|nr:hypothetical protein NDU88_003379 [Pleurodeles waltl]
MVTPRGVADLRPQVNWCRGSTAWGGAQRRGLPYSANPALLPSVTRRGRNGAGAPQHLFTCGPPTTTLASFLHYRLYTACGGGPGPRPSAVSDYWIWPGATLRAVGVGLAPGIINGPMLHWGPSGESPPHQEYCLLLPVLTIFPPLLEGPYYFSEDLWTSRGCVNGAGGEGRRGWIGTLDASQQ